MEGEVIVRLKSKIQTMKEERDSVNQALANEKSVLTQVESQLHNLKMEFDKRSLAVKEKEAKLLRYTKIIEESEMAIGKLLENS